MPAVPPALIVAMHVSRAEEEKLGIEAADTVSYRRAVGMPDTDGLESLDDFTQLGLIVKRRRADTSASALSESGAASHTHVHQKRRLIEDN